jgi:hypothetical protein
LGTNPSEVSNARIQEYEIESTKKEIHLNEEIEA